MTIQKCGLRLTVAGDLQPEFLGNFDSEVEWRINLWLSAYMKSLGPVAGEDECMWSLEPRTKQTVSSFSKATDLRRMLILAPPVATPCFLGKPFVHFHQRQRHRSRNPHGE